MKKLSRVVSLSVKFPELDRLTGADICSLLVDQKRTRGKIHLVDDQKSIFKVEFYNNGARPFQFELGELSMRMISAENPSIVSFGEFEYYTESADGWLHIEGDCGQFSFLCENVIVTQIQGEHDVPPKSDRAVG